LHTGFVDEFLARRGPFVPHFDLESVAALVAAYHSAKGGVRAETPPPPRSRWLDIGRREVLR
jgi:hypothetical protein